MTKKRTIEIFSAGCAVCDAAVQLVQSLACPSCEIMVLDMHDPSVVRRAQNLGVRSVPAVIVDGKLLDCCRGRGLDESALKGAGVGQAIA